MARPLFLAAAWCAVLTAGSAAAGDTPGAASSPQEAGGAPAAGAAPASAPVELLDVDDLTCAAQGAAGGSVLAVADGEEVRAGEVLPLLFLTHTELVYAALEQAVRRRLMVKEARRLGVHIGADQVEKSMAAVLKAQSDEFELAAGPGSDFEQYILERYGTTSQAYRAAVRDQVMEELFLARLIRYQARLEERIQVRVIVVEGFDAAREIAAKLDEGANFAALARAQSLDRSARLGGLLPPVARDCPHPLLQGAASLKPGQRAELSSIPGKSGELFRILRLEKELPADSRPYGEQAAEIERELETRALDPFELTEWDRRVRERYRIEVRMGRA